MTKYLPCNSHSPPMISSSPQNFQSSSSLVQFIPTLNFRRRLDVDLQHLNSHRFKVDAEFLGSECSSIKKSSTSRLLQKLELINKSINKKVKLKHSNFLGSVNDTNTNRITSTFRHEDTDQTQMNCEINSCASCTYNNFENGQLVVREPDSRSPNLNGVPKNYHALIQRIDGHTISYEDSFATDQSYHDPPEFACAEIIDQCENLLSDSNGSPELYQQTSRYLNLVSKYFKNKIDAIEFMENETIE